MVKYLDIKDLVVEHNQMQMPEDFYDLLEFCKSIDKKNPKRIYFRLILIISFKLKIINLFVEKKNNNKLKQTKKRCPTRIKYRINRRLRSRFIWPQAKL